MVEKPDSVHRVLGLQVTLLLEPQPPVVRQEVLRQADVRLFGPPVEPVRQRDRHVLLRRRQPDVLPRLRGVLELLVREVQLREDV